MAKTPENRRFNPDHKKFRELKDWPVLRVKNPDNLARGMVITLAEDESVLLFYDAHGKEWRVVEGNNA